jgi:hypothetical protein
MTTAFDEVPMAGERYGLPDAHVMPSVAAWICDADTSAMV